MHGYEANSRIDVTKSWLPMALTNASHSRLPTLGLGDAYTRAFTAYSPKRGETQVLRLLDFKD